MRRREKGEWREKDKWREGRRDKKGGVGNRGEEKRIERRGITGEREE